MSARKDTIKYRKGYKYQLAELYFRQTDIYPQEDVITDFIVLGKTGGLYISAGYAWDGASGPTFDSACTMRPCLVHDALYQLMRMGLLPGSARRKVDELLYTDLRDDGMSWARAQLWHHAVRRYAAGAADPSSLRKIYTAP